MEYNSFQQLAIPLARGGVNFAPAQPLINAIREKQLPKNQGKFHDAVKARYNYYMNYEKQAWWELISTAQLVALFRRGNQLLVRRPYGPGYYVRPVAPDDTYRQTAMNLMTFHSQVCEAKIIASNPNVNMRPAGEEPADIAAAQACRPYVDHYENEWYTYKFSRREAIYLLTNGMAIHRVRWNPLLGNYSMPTQEVSQREVEVDGGDGECAECAYQGEGRDFEPTEYGFRCPQCQSEAVDVTPPRKQSLSQISMGQARSTGEPEIMQCPFPAWRWDLSKDLQDSSWAIYRQRITQGAVSMMLGDMVVPDSQSSDDHGLAVLHALAYAGQAFDGFSRTNFSRAHDLYDKKPTLAEFWMGPDDYADIDVEGGMTVSGVQLPSGKLGQFFHDPLCFVSLNDMSLLVGVYVKESHRDEVVTTHWFMDADSGVGRGMEDTAAVQKRFNAVDGQIYQGLATTATPAVITDLSILKEDHGQYLFRPGVNIDVNLAMLPPNTKLSDAFFLGNPGAINPQYIQYSSVFLKQMFDMSSLAVEFSEVLSIDNRTATGAQITAALANSLYGPMLASKGESRVRIAKMLVCLYAKHGTGGRYFPGSGNARGRMVSPEDLKGRVVFELVPNSTLPVTPFSQQTDVRVFFESFGGAPVAAQLRKQEPEFFRATSAPFNIKFTPDDVDDVSTLCLGRMEQMEQALMAGVDDPNMLVEMLRPPVSMYEPKHKEKRDWYGTWLDLQSGQKAPLILRAAAEAMWNLHENYATQIRLPQAMNEGMVMAAAQAPAALGAAAMQGQQEAAPAEDKTVEIEAEKEMQESEQAFESQMKDKEIAGQLAVTREQGRNQLENTRVAGQNAVKVAKARPRPKPSKAA